jgi:surface polysaccharide O-acyltransferase-like enzyme
LDVDKEATSLAWLDLLRVAAALAVVILHVSAEPVVFVRDRDSPLWHAGNVFDSLSRWCIGVFIMVSGALLLDPARRESPGDFYAKRARRIVVPILFWSTAYLGLTATREPVTTGKIARLLWEGRPWYHMWYLFMVIGLYAVTPLLRVYVKRASVRVRWSVIVISLFLASAWDLHLSIERRPLPDVVPTMFVPYLGYYLAGYELRRLAPARLRPGWLWAIFTAASIATAVGTHSLVEAYGISRLGLYMYEYLSPNVILMSVAIFCLASRTENPASEARGGGAAMMRGAIWAAPLTLGIYLWHPMVILGLRQLGYHAIGTRSVFGVLLVALPAFAASLALTWAMSRLPVLKWAVGLR